MDTNLQKLKQLIIESSLPVNEQEDLISFFAKAQDNDLEATVELFNEDPTWIGKINENYKAKQAALATGNQALWDRIIKEEEAQLEELEQ